MTNMLPSGTAFHASSHFFANLFDRKTNNLFSQFMHVRHVKEKSAFLNSLEEDFTNLL